MQEEVENDNVNAGQSESAGTETIAEDMEITTTTETTPTPTPTTSATPATSTIAITTNTTNTTNMVGITNTAKVESIEKQESKNIKKGYIAVVDTNYLVHNLSLFESIVLCAKIRRRRKSQGGQESTERENQLEIIIPWVVFGELDSLNKAKSRRAVSMALEEEMTSTITQRKAHAALKYLDGALMVQDNPERYAQDCSRDGKEQPEGKGANNAKYEEYDVLRGQRMDERTEEMRLREKKEIYIECDDKILDCCRYFSDKEGKSVTLLTNDKNLRIKAKVHGIKVVVGKQGEGSGYDAQNIVGRICNEIEQNEEDKADYLKEYEKLMKKNEAHRLEMPASFSDDENALTLDQRIDQLKHSFGKNKGKEKKTFGYDFGFGFGLGLGFQDNRRKRRDYEYNSRKRALDSISFSPPPQSNYPSTVKKDGSGGTYADQMWEMRGKNNNPMLKRKHWDGGRNPWHQQKKTATANGVGEQQAGDTNFVESSRNGSVNENSYSNGNINGSENDDGTAMDISTTIRERKIKNATPITAKLSAATENASTDDHTGTKMTGVSPTGTSTSVGDINSMEKHP
ncbi:hypothetical protein AX774_g1841 [Zancudomyces culisetae]|uniref:PIN domain-containing protein n=1 Tax=Zancudomyces culisetae TaxID=1213189 RepID=A0A1R1PUN9_ZANCU|nr:hypothetical protein AX774_g1841 [Zancudomyces culisetae]|eukprot:OMH84629.1 hypothetical protein AX774_g1841 [Zancudomyces culisetae]